MSQMRGEKSVIETPMGSDVIDRLQRSYGLSVAELSFLGGELDLNYRVTTETGRRYLAKWQLRRVDECSQSWREDILVHLAARETGVAVPTIVPTVYGARHDEVDSVDAVLTLFDWVAGTEWARIDRHSVSLLGQLGAASARITQALSGFPVGGLPSTHHWDVRRCREAIMSCVAQNGALADEDYVRTTLDWFTGVAPKLATLPHAVLHHDLNDHNVLVDPNRDVIAGVLDFNDALYSVRVAEVAIAGAYAMLRRTRPLDALGYVVAGYHHVTPLSDEELAVIYPLAASRLCVQVLTWTVRGGITPTTYGSMRMKHTLPTLQKVLTVNVDRAADHLRSACMKEQ